jgi:hypothetical protein
MMSVSRTFKISQIIICFSTEFLSHGLLKLSHLADLEQTEHKITPQQQSLRNRRRPRKAIAAAISALLDNGLINGEGVATLSQYRPDELAKSMSVPTALSGEL